MLVIITSTAHKSIGKLRKAQTREGGRERTCYQEGYGA